MKSEVKSWKLKSGGTFSGRACPPLGRNCKSAIANCKLQIGRGTSDNLQIDIYNSQFAILREHSGGQARPLNGRIARHSAFRLPPSAFRLRRAFTLIELLVVITIISMLAGMAMMALYSAQESARYEKTEALIGKLDALIRQKWDSYRTRRVAVYYQNVINNPTVTSRARVRLIAVRDLMRMELPDRWSDITDPQVQMNVSDPSGSIDFKLQSVPALTQGYQRRVAAISAQQTPQQKQKTGVYQGAECLYLIVTSSVGDGIGGRELFKESDIGDVDGDGFKEFIDAWGNPIRFLRWAPGFDSELQPHRRYPTYTIGQSYNNFLWGDPVKNHDPFDSRRGHGDAFALYPLIYSAGPDQIFDIRSDLDADEADPGTQAFHYAQHGMNPYYFSSTDPLLPPSVPMMIGQPADLRSDKFGPADGVQNWHDNIHNHRMTAN